MTHYPGAFEILVGGSDRVADLLKLPGARSAERPEPKPITIQGTLVLEEKPRTHEAPDDRGAPQIFA